ncbi:MAG: carboxypeptidase M32, partial [Acidobacteriota bacterium]|nr:carboxypeptidase M32 [Acidobacteriota bacterium]
AWPAPEQEIFLREVTARLGFDYRRGRIDVSLHPFCSGSGDDVRMTTRFQPEAPLDALFSSLHETGHGLYEQGLPVAHRGTALGMHAGMAVHESQSRLWENQVGRSRGFWRYLEPRLRAVAPVALEGLSAEDMYGVVNSVAVTPIRVDSDEVTYNLHILLRFDLERQLFAGSLTVRDLPEAWRSGLKARLGISPTSDREGVLQDVHWSGGAFGYFPSYTLGNMMAAQLWYAAAEARPGLEDEFACGEFGWLLEWLRTHIHVHGRRWPGAELIENVTGRELSAEALLRYLRDRYGALYLA